MRRSLCSMRLRRARASKARSCSASSRLRASPGAGHPPRLRGLFRPAGPSRRTPAGFLRPRHDLEPVERRTRPDPGRDRCAPGEHDLGSRGADGEPEGQALQGRSAPRGFQAGRPCALESAAADLPSPSGGTASRQAGHEHGVERKERPRAPPTGPTYTLPWRFPPGGTDSSVRRRPSTSRTSPSEIGPTGPWARARPAGRAPGRVRAMRARRAPSRDPATPPRWRSPAALPERPAGAGEIAQRRQVLELPLHPLCLGFRHPERRQRGAQLRPASLQPALPSLAPPITAAS